MRRARYWTRAESEFAGLQIKARGWSDESLDAARAKALEIASRIAERVAGGFGSMPRYPYGDRPLPEPVIREFTGAILTRNAYGALVLNTDQMMFVDIDRKTPPAKSGGLFSSLFGKPKPASPPVQDPVIDAIAGITARRKLGARLYETAAGYRLIVTSERFVAGSPDAETLLNEYNSDPLYIRLCRMQESFRARLTPKPWRCDYNAPYGEYPFETARAREIAQRWENAYEAKSAGYATCRFISALGSPHIDADFNELIEFHDQGSKAFLSLPLA